MVIHQLPTVAKGWNTHGATMKQVDAYYMNDGTDCPGSNSEYAGTAAYQGRTDIAVLVSLVIQQMIQSTTAFRTEYLYNMPNENRVFMLLLLTTVCIALEMNRKLKIKTNNKCSIIAETETVMRIVCSGYAPALSS